MKAELNLATAEARKVNAFGTNQNSIIDNSKISSKKLYFPLLGVNK